MPTPKRRKKQAPSLILTLLFSLGTALSLGCTTKNTAPTAQKPDPDDPYQAPDGQLITLLDPGSAPRAPLRYAFELAATCPLHLEATRQFSHWVDGQPPERGQSVGQSIDIHVGIRPDTPGSHALTISPKASADALSAQQPTLTHHLSAAGDFEWGGRELDEDLRSAQTYLAGLFILWPKAAIGVGARWKTLASHEDGLRSEVFYELKALEGGKASVSVHIEQSAGAKDLPPDPHMPDTDLKLESLSNLIEGTIITGLSTFYLEAEILNSSQNHIQATHNGVTLNLKQVVTTNVQAQSQTCFEPSPPKSAPDGDQTEQPTPLKD